MVEVLVPIALFVSFAVVVVAVTKIVSEGRTRRQLIQSGATAELARAVIAKPEEDVGLRTALQVGLVVGAIGLALIIVQFLPYQPDDPISVGVVLVFAAAGFLGYYAAGRRMTRQQRAGTT